MLTTLQKTAARLLVGSFLLFFSLSAAQASMFANASPTPASTQTPFIPSPTPEVTAVPGFSLQIVTEQVAAKDAPFRVLIYHTHTYEAFTSTPAHAYTSNEKWRTSNHQCNVVALGAYLTELLTQAGVSVTHDTTDFEPPVLSSAYERSLHMLEERTASGEAYDLYIDLHRDAYSENNGPNTVQAAGEDVARLMFLIGKGTGQTGAGYDVKPDYESNHAIATLLTNRLNMQVENICRPVKTKTGRYNQHIAPCCVLIEVGNNQNTLEEALRAMPYLCNAICSLADGQIE